MKPWRTLWLKLHLLGRFHTALPLLVLPMLLAGCATGVRSSIVWQGPDGARSGITVGTYNLMGLADPDGLVRTLRELDFVEVWAFQEVHQFMPNGQEMAALQESAPPERLLQILPAGSWHVYYVPLNFTETPTGKVWEGQVIASRYPQTDKQCWPLRATGAKKRAALACHVSAGMREILVVNADHEMALFGIGPSDRMHQAEDLASRLRRHPDGQTNTTDAVVVLGDFNTSGKLFVPWGVTARGEIRLLSDTFARVGLWPLPGPGAFFPTFRSFGISRPLDHIYRRDADCYRWGTTTRYSGSDHRPLWATLRWENDGAERDE